VCVVSSSQHESSISWQRDTVARKRSCSQTDIRRCWRPSRTCGVALWAVLAVAAVTPACVSAQFLLYGAYLKPVAIVASRAGRARKRHEVASPCPCPSLRTSGADPFQRPDLAPQLWHTPDCSNGRCECTSPRACLPPGSMLLGKGVTAGSKDFCAPYVTYTACVVVEREGDTVRLSHWHTGIADSCACEEPQRSQGGASLLTTPRSLRRVVGLGYDAYSTWLSFDCVL
jgi:hypothetical protein